MEEPSSEHQPGTGRRQRVRRLVRELLTTLLPAVLLALFARTLVAEAAIVDGPSMQPNLYTGYAVLAEKISYHLHPPQRGDVVLFQLPGENILLVKRVIGLAGETVAVRGGHAYVDGQPLAEPWVTYFGGPDCLPARVPPGHVFVLGDNRDDSRDSRIFGPVPLDAIRGHVVLIFWPPAEIKSVPE
jgi:signal peptidase I